MWNIKCMIIPVILGLKKNLKSHSRETFSRFTTKDSHTRNITYNTEKFCSLKLEA